MKGFSRREIGLVDEPHSWMGGEAVLGSQAQQHARRQARTGRRGVGVVTGLAFVTGIALGAVAAALWARRNRVPLSAG